MASISLSVSIQLAGSAPITAALPAEAVEATDKIAITIEPDTADRIVDLQPGAAASIRLLLVQSSRYAGDLSFVASDGTNDSSAVVLDSPQLFTSGSVGLFGVDPNRLVFTNASTAASADIEIFVARDATP